MIKCLGGGMKNLKEDVKILFENEKELEQTICNATQVKCNSCTMEDWNSHEKSIVWYVDIRCVYKY